MKNIGYIWIISLVFISCGKSPVKEKPTKDVITNSQVPKAYEWHQPISEYHGSKMELYGFIWLDKIEGTFRKGSYTIYEKPNCYECREVKMELLQDLLIIDLIDTSFVPDSTSPQWRLIKVVGMVNNNFIQPEMIQRSVYSYPDYENSGYQQITDEWISTKPGNGKYVYVDGIISPNGISFIDGYATFSIKGTGLKNMISIYVKKGKLNDQAEEIVGANGPMIINTRDQLGNSIAKKKIRLYGVWKNFIHPQEAKTAGMVFVESIKIL